MPSASILDSVRGEPLRSGGSPNVSYPPIPFHSRRKVKSRIFSSIWCDDGNGKRSGGGAMQTLPQARWNASQMLRPERSLEVRILFTPHLSGVLPV